MARFASTTKARSCEPPQVSFRPTMGSKRRSVLLYWVFKYVAFAPLCRLLFRPSVSGAENIPASGAAILVSNHISAGDTFLLPSMIRRRVTFPAKIELFHGRGLKGRLLSWFLTMSWMKHLQDNGWRYGTKRDDHRRIHPSLRPWSELTPADQEKTREGVANALRILNRLGYRSTVLRPPGVAGDAGPAGGWVEVIRQGEVTAVRRDAPWNWTNESGEAMTSSASNSLYDLI